MAVQIDTEELKGCKSYFAWMMDKTQPDADHLYSKVPEDLCRLMFSMDFIWNDISEDGIRAKDATDIRKIYAENVGEVCGKNEREIDRIWKSVHGKCSVLELIFSMCMKLDEMVNEGKEGEMIPCFFSILCGNIGFLPVVVAENSEENQPSEALMTNWKACIERLMNRKYEPDGSQGGLFPLKKWSEKDGKDQRTVSIWYQMNAWLNENLDEDEHFMITYYPVFKVKLAEK